MIEKEERKRAKYEQRKIQKEDGFGENGEIEGLGLEKGEKVDQNNNFSCVKTQQSEILKS